MVTVQLEIGGTGLMAFSHGTMPVFDPPCQFIPSAPDLCSTPPIVLSSILIPLVLVGRLGSLRVGVSGVVLEFVGCGTYQLLLCRSFQ